jgi:uncharacterized protein (TIGR02302 family)
MSDSGGSLPRGHDRSAIENAVRERIRRALVRARIILFWETLWPLVAPFLALAGLFAIISWFGIWREVSDIVRIGILALFAVAVAWLLFRTRTIARPSRNAALARVEQATGALHRPATAFADRLAAGAGDPAGRALWAAHRERLLASLGRLKAGIPRPGLVRRDPYALRFLVAVVFIIAFVFAGPERAERLAEAFRGGEPASVTIARIDAWVTPPAYTGRPPIFLTGDAAKPSGTEYSVPVGSVVTVRTGGAHDLDVFSTEAGGMKPAETVAADKTASPDRNTDTANAAPFERQVKLGGATTVSIRKGDRDIMAWRFAVVPDAPPRIAFLKPPGPTVSGALSLSYSLQDDYGVVAARAEIVPVGTETSKTGVRPLIAAPAVELSLPQLRTRSGNAETIRDLTAHPWAGGKVRITLVARDEAGQEGRSNPVEVVLPARQFNEPLARAVVEQRTGLALDANAADRTADALDALTSVPEIGIPNPSQYLALRSAYYRLLTARNDDDLKGMVDYLWTIALGIEDGDMSLAADALRSAQEALRQALEKGAPDAEIKRLTDQLRDALQKFMQALADEARRNPQGAMLPPNSNVHSVRPQDLERMLDQIENLAKNGARDAARQLLSQLQNMLENLQSGRPMVGDQQNSDQMMESLNDLSDLIQRQQSLMDRTFRTNSGLGEDGKPMTKDELDQALRDLKADQEGLQQSLKDLMSKLQDMGVEPNGKFGQAGEAMGRAAGSLGGGKPGAAVGDQGQALEALRQGAQGMAQQFASRGNRGGGLRGGDSLPSEDPLGRPQRTTGPDLGNTVKVPDEIDIQRAREILDAIRKKLGEPGQSDLERDYLERLLDRL